MKLVLFRLFLGFLIFMPAGYAGSQPAGLRAGFDAAEYADMLWLAFYGLSDSLKNQPDHSLNRGEYHRLFRSEEVGLYNRCEVYLRNDSVIVLSLRGTVNKLQSWLENFYSGMIPAEGTLQLSDGYTFRYKLANRSQAMVHTGWTIGTGFLVKEYLPLLESKLAAGYRKIIVTGHSQGGALSFLNTSFIYYYFKDKYPGISLKTYASAAPKPGNLYYAYDFEYLSGDGYAFRVVNAVDWVPESPVSVQAIGDFNAVNPLAGAPAIIQKQKWPDRMVLKHMYRKMRNGSEKAARRYTRYLGNGVGKQVKQALPGFVPPEYTGGTNFSTAGAPIILMPDDGYRKLFPDNPSNVFVHHLYAPYYYLLKRFYPF